MMLKSQQNTVQLSTANKKVKREKQVFIQTKLNLKNKISKKNKRREKSFFKSFFVSQSEEEEELVKGVALLGAVCVVLMS
jgi:hypothetical protein